MSQTRSAVKKAGLLYFVFVMYAYTTGGPFGLEEMVTTSGPGMTLLYLLVIPLFWSIPVSLATAELTTAIPVEGGFYRWVRASHGDFWGFLTGWWNWSASWLLAASYAVLFADYLANYFPGLAGWKHYLVALSLIALFAYINIRGIQMVGVVATILGICILLPVVAECVIAATKWQHNPFHPMIPPHVPTFQIFGVGLALGLWLYSGTSSVPAWRRKSTIRKEATRWRSRLSSRCQSPLIFFPHCFHWQRWAIGKTGTPRIWRLLPG